MWTFQNVVIGRVNKSQFQSTSCFFFKFFEVFKKHILVRNFKAVFWVFIFWLKEDFSVFNAWSPLNIVNRIYFLDVRSQTFQSVSDLRSYRTSCQSPNLLEVGELSDFHTIKPNFPTKTSWTSWWVFPVIFNKTNIVFQRIDTQFFQWLKVEFLDVWWWWFHHHLELVVLVKTVWVFSVTSISWTTWWLYISRIPWLGTNSTKESVRTHCSRTFFIIISLHEHTTLVIPVLLQSKDDFLESQFFRHYLLLFL